MHVPSQQPNRPRVNRGDIERLTSWRETHDDWNALRRRLSSYTALGEDAFAVEADLMSET